MVGFIWMKRGSASTRVSAPKATISTVLMTSAVEIRPRSRCDTTIEATEATMMMPVAHISPRKR